MLLYHNMVNGCIDLYIPILLNNVFTHCDTMPSLKGTASVALVSQGSCRHTSCLNSPSWECPLEIDDWEIGMYYFVS